MRLQLLLGREELQEPQLQVVEVREVGAHMDALGIAHHLGVQALDQGRPPRMYLAPAS